MTLNPEKRTPSPLRAVRLLVLAVASIVGMAYLSASSRVYRSQQCADNLTVENLNRAAQLEPMNADFRHRLGRYSLLLQDFPSAIRQIQQAIQLNPYDAHYWLDLASAYLAAGDMDGERQAISAALETDPTTPEVIWQTANYELVQGNTSVAMQRFHTLLEHNADFVSPVLNVCWRATRDPRLIVENVLPPRPEFHLAFMNFLLNNRHPEAVPLVWSHLIALKVPFSVRLAFPYLDYLLNSGDLAQAAQAWAQLGDPNPEFRPYVTSDNLIVNGGFELDLLNGGLDWRYSAKPGTSVNIDVTRARNGNRSLSIDFDGAPDDSGVYQLVPVRANTQYKFSGFMMSDSVETTSRPRFSIVSMKGSKQCVLTDGMLGSTGWHEFDGEFTTGPQPDLLVVQIVRVPSKPLIRGRIWVDDLKLTPTQ